MERIVSLADFAEALREVAEDAGGEYVLVGGLAVGAWARAFDIGDGTPMFSKDIDLRGTRLAAKAVVQALKKEGVGIKGFVSITRKEPPGLGKNYVAPIELRDGRATQVEVPEALPWVDDGPERPYGFGVEVEGIPLLVRFRMDPSQQRQDEFVFIPAEIVKNIGKSPADWDDPGWN